MKLSGELPLTKSDTDTRPGRVDRIFGMDWLAFSEAMAADMAQRAVLIKALQEQGDAGAQSTARILLTAQEVLLGLQRAIVAGLGASMGEPDG